MEKNRINEIANALIADKDELRAILSMDIEEAAKELNKKGLNTTADELAEFSRIFQEDMDKIQAAGGELNEEDLENVSGGFLITAGTLIGIAALGSGIGLGAGIGANWLFGHWKWGRFY